MEIFAQEAFMQAGAVCLNTRADVNPAIYAFRDHGARHTSLSVMWLAYCVCPAYRIGPIRSTWLYRLTLLSFLELDTANATSRQDVRVLSLIARPALFPECFT